MASASELKLNTVTTIMELTPIFLFGIWQLILDFYLETYLLPLIKNLNFSSKSIFTPIL